MVYIEEEYSILLEPELAGVAALIHWRIRFKPGGLSHWVKVSNPLTKLLCSYTMSLLKASVPNLSSSVPVDLPICCLSF